MTAIADTAGQQAPGGLATAHFRYPGSPPFQDDELDRVLFQGRAREAESVLHAILGSNLFLLYSVSGLGKSSLLNAGVLHALRDRDHWPVRIRLNDPTVDPIKEIADQIHQAADADPSVEVLPAPDRPSTGDADDLWDLLASIEVWRNNELQRPVLVLDQFEELFTLGWDPRVRQRFIEDLGEVVRGHRRPDRGAPAPESIAPDAKFVLVIREEKLGELEALATEIPQVMRNRFRLGPLDADQAEAAVRTPGQIDDPRLDSPRFTYTQSAVDMLLDFLGSAADAAGSPTGVGRSGINPSQLQIICHYIERETVAAKVEELPPGADVEIDAEDLGGTEGLERILATFYRRSVEQFPPADRPAIRKLCESGLINADGRRLSLEEGDIEARYAVDRAALERLVDERLLRAEPRVGSLYYEIAHDTLVGPILEDRDQRNAIRRRRRNRLLAIIGAIVLLAAVTAVIAVVVGDIEPETQDVEIGRTETATVTGGEEAVVYSIDADPRDAIVLDVRPEGDLNPAVSVTTAGGVTRIENRGGRGEPEQVVIPASGDGDPLLEVRVTSFDGTGGEFRLTAATEGPVELVPSETIDGNTEGSADDANQVAVFTVPVDGSSDEDSVEVTVTPGMALGGSRQGTESGGKALDVVVSSIDPSGGGESVDVAGAGGAEVVVLTGEGRHTVVVSGAGTSAGRFQIQANRLGDMQLGTAAISLPLVRGEPQRGITSPDVEQSFVVEGSPDEWTGISVQPDPVVDPLLTVTVDGETFEWDFFAEGVAEYLVLPPGTGEITVEVTDFNSFAGPFEVLATRVDPSPVTPPVSWAQGPRTYRVDTSGAGDAVVFSVGSGPASEMVVQAVSGSEADADILFGFAGPDEPAELLLSGAVAETHWVTVIPSDRFSYQPMLREPERVTVAPGQEERLASPAVVIVEVTGDEVLDLTVTPVPGEGVQVDVIDPEGGVGAFASDGFGEAVEVVIGEFGPGTYEVSVNPFGAGDYAVTLGGG